MAFSTGATSAVSAQGASDIQLCLVEYLTSRVWALTFKTFHRAIKKMKLPSQIPSHQLPDLPEMFCLLDPHLLLRSVCSSCLGQLRLPNVPLHKLTLASLLPEVGGNVQVQHTPPVNHFLPVLRGLPISSGLHTPALPLRLSTEEKHLRSVLLPLLKEGAGPSFGRAY